LAFKAMSSLMETRSKSRGAQIQTSSRHVLEDPDARSSTDPRFKHAYGWQDWRGGCCRRRQSLRGGAATRPPGNAPVRPDGPSFDEPT